jgi:hypothetical protein
MRQTLILKNNQLAGSVPAPEELKIGEIAINTADAIIYTKTNNGIVTAIGVGGTSDGVLLAPVQSVAGRIGNITLSKNDVGLTNIDNISDINKPVSIAQAAADTAVRNIAASDATTKANSAQAFAIQRSNHTGTQLSSSISDFTSAVITATPVKSVAGKTGIVVLTKADIGLNNVDNTSDTNKPVSNAQASANAVVLSSAEAIAIDRANSARDFAIQRNNHTGVQAISTITNLQTSLNDKANLNHNHDDRYYTETEVNSLLNTKQPLGNYATLVAGLVPASQLPSYVDDILEYANLASFPNNGEIGKIYVARDNNNIYRWSGSSYVEISASPGTTDAVPEGVSNKYYTDNRAKAAAPVQSVSGRIGDISLTKVDVNLSNVDNTSDLDKPISTAVNNALLDKASLNHNHALPNENTSIGRSSLISVTTGNRNTSVGCDAMEFNTSGINNSAFGSPALYQNIDGINNTSVGAWSMIFNASGNENTAVGTGGLSNNVTGSNNISIGAASLFNNTTGVNNTCIGTFAAVNNTTGSNNTMVGFGTTTLSSGLSNCIVLGANAVADSSGEFVIGSSSNPINTSSNVGVSGGASFLPGRPLGYIDLRLNGTIVKIPFYAA